jgi:cyclic-di-GMP phosphodiesterase TipF (flagellum assembly factor)
VTLALIVLGYEVTQRLGRDDRVSALEARVERLTESAETASGGKDVGAVVAEVKILQSLIEELYARRRTEPPAEAPGHATGTPDRAGANGHGGRAEPKFGVPARVDESAVLEALRDGLKEDRVEIALQPIVGLPQRKRRHFECFSRIRKIDGGLLLPEQYIGLAERTGLVNALDNMLLIRCVQLLRKMRRANPTVGFFCNISPHTLADRSFFRDFVAFMRQNAELASSIVFEFPQRIMRSNDPDLLRDLDALAALGFRYSLDQVTDLALDPHDLVNQHFAFVKIEVGRFLAGAKAGNGLDAGRLKRRLDSFGLDLIVEKIEAESDLLELLDLNVDYGQGYLFGEPRLTRIEA